MIPSVSVAHNYEKHRIDFRHFVSGCWYGKNDAILSPALGWLWPTELCYRLSIAEYKILCNLDKSEKRQSIFNSTKCHLIVEHNNSASLSQTK